MQSIHRQRNRLLVEALASGRYQQGRSILNRDNTYYCCLGVACEVAIQNGLELEVLRSMSHPGRVDYNEQDCIPPYEVAQWYGWDTSNPQLMSESGKSYPASYLNDIFKWDFETIADAFERTFVEES